MSVIAIALLAALNGAASQDQAEPRVETRSEIRFISAGGEGPGRLDADGDGVVTREEFSAPMGNAFDRLDANDDGRLSTEELASGHGEGGPGHRVMMMGGPGGPGEHDVRVITRDGGPGGPGGPGVHIITRDGHGGPGGHGMPMVFRSGGEGGDVRVFNFRHGGPEGGPMPGGPGSHQIFVRRFGGPDGPGEMDKNGDGKVSQEEFLAPLREAFGRMDADNDGFLDGGEGRPTPPSAD
jgi:hypothetical protein